MLDRRSLFLATGCLGLFGTQLGYAAEPIRSKLAEVHSQTADARSAQTDELEVRGVLQAYVESTRTGNAQRARTLFHPQAIMSGQMDGGEVRTGTPEPFFKVLEAHPAASSGVKSYTGRITAITVAGKTATGTLVEQNLYGYNFIDHFHLLELNGRWQIISKLFHGTSLPTVTPAPAKPQ
jgi:4-oxalocrotonate tautomerase